MNDATPTLEQLQQSIEPLSLKEKRALRTWLDKQILQERKTFIHSDFPAPVHEFLKTRVALTSDLSMLNEHLTD